MHRSNYECYPNPDGTKGWVWNPITGSLGDCPNPNARRLANTRLRERYLANKQVSLMNVQGVYEDTMNIEINHRRQDPFYPRLWPERLRELQPIGGLVCELVYPPKTAKGIFVCDMSDLFGIGIPGEWTQAVLNLIKKWPAHRFYLLTKQPQNLIKFSPFPDNCWVGVTVCNDKRLTDAVWTLRDIEAKVKYLSLEPLLGKIDDSHLSVLLPHINWVIIGAQTKPLKRPHPSWVREITEAAIKAGIAVFHKNNLKETGGVLKIILNDDQFKEVYGVDFKQELPDSKEGR